MNGNVVTLPKNDTRQTWYLRCGNYFDNILIGLIQAVLINIGDNLVIRHDEVGQNLLLRELGQRLDRPTPNTTTHLDLDLKTDSAPPQRPRRTSRIGSTAS
ncbi:hypothetical protein [Spirosoma arcticum]